MKKLTVLFASMLINSFAYAENSQLPFIPTAMVLDKVGFQISSKQWVTTETALVTVNINATLSNADLVQARADIVDKLNKIAKGEWHLTQFVRSQDTSGLEKLFVEAQARTSQSNLKDIYKNVKAVSKPGVTYTINGIEFKPSTQEVQEAKTQLRQKLYQMVSEEVVRLNKIYTNQVYSVNNLYISDGETPMPMPMPMPMQATMNKVSFQAAASPQADINVSNELMMTAVVELASNRKGN